MLPKQKRASHFLTGGRGVDLISLVASGRHLATKSASYMDKIPTECISNVTCLCALRSFD